MKFILRTVVATAPSYTYNITTGQNVPNGKYTAAVSYQLLQDDTIIGTYTSRDQAIDAAKYLKKIKFEQEEVLDV